MQTVFCIFNKENQVIFPPDNTTLYSEDIYVNTNYNKCSDRQRRYMVYAANYTLKTAFRL